MRAKEFLIDHQLVNEAAELANISFYIGLINNMVTFIELITSTIQNDARDDNAKQELSMMQQQFRKPIVRTMDFMHVASNPNIYQDPEIAKIVLKYIADMLMYIETEIKRCIKPELQSKWMNKVVQLKDKYRNAERQIG